MVFPQHLLVVAFAFLALPSFVNAGLFPKKSKVKHLDPEGFREVLKEERTFVAAFVAPWCGHCHKLAPELIRAAKGLDPLVPVYAVDCDDNMNKPLCAEQGVKGFPTIKLFPQGTKVPPLEFTGTRTATSLFYWTSQSVPFKVTRTQTVEGVASLIRKNPGKPKAVLMNKTPKMPLLWKVLSNKYGDQIVFVNCRDRRGDISVKMGFEAGQKGKAKVLMYGVDDEEPILYEGIMKFSALSEFFDQVLEGEVDISHASLNAKQEVLKVPESERKDLDDEAHIGDAGHRGFNPHEGINIEELTKLGLNPHAAGHPGAANPHSFHAGDSKAKAADEKAGKGTASSSPKSKSSSEVESAPSASSSTVGSVTRKEKTQSTTASTKSETSASLKDTVSPTSGEDSANASGDPVAEHVKDEL